MNKITISAIVLTIFIVFSVGIVTLESQQDAIDQYCDNRTGLHGTELVVNCTEADSK